MAILNIMGVMINRKEKYSNTVKFSHKIDKIKNNSYICVELYFLIKTGIET